MNVACVIQARLGSTRLPGKVLYPIGGRSVIEWVVRRCEESPAVDATYVAVGDEPENDALTELCRRRDIQSVRGPEHNLLARHKMVADLTECDALCRVTGDCPFVPTAEVTRTIEEHVNASADHTTNKGDEMPIGTAVHVLRPSVLDILSARGHRHPVKPIREHPGEWDVCRTTNETWTQFSEAHTAVDTPEDYWSLVDAVRAVGTDPFAVTEWMSEHTTPPPGK